MKELLIVALLISSLFLGIIPYESHVDICNKIGLSSCPGHSLIIFSSILTFTLAVIVSQEDFFIKIYKKIKNIFQNGGRIVKATSKLISSTADNFDSLDDFTDTVETLVEGATL